MKRFIITGAPGAGKTAIIRQLELEGFSVVEEAATDVIASAHARGAAEPWTDSLFIDAVADLQTGVVPASVAAVSGWRISFEETLRFERIHEETYRGLAVDYLPVGDTTISPGSCPSCECARYTVPSFVTTPLRAPSCVGTCAIKLSLPAASTRATVSRASLAAPT